MNILEKLRNDINEIDSELMILLAKRRRISHLVGENKLKMQKPIRDPSREQALLLRLIDYGRSLGLDTHYITQIFQVIIEDSVLNQQALLQRHINEGAAQSSCRVAFLGGQGSYSYLACQKYFSRRVDSITEIGCASFDEIIEHVENGNADHALLPIENTSSGSINEVYDLLQHAKVHITGELTQPVNHCLVATQDVSPTQIRTIYCHHQPHTQCSKYIATLKDVHIEFCDSTSAAFKKVQELDRDDIAAIGSAEGAKVYGLLAIEEALANQSQNYSRFIVVSPKPVQVAPQVPAKTTIIMTTGQKAGALVDALLVLKEHDIPMHKLESRPIYGNPWEEMFYIDAIANIDSEQMQKALAALEPIVGFVKVLGCYPGEDVVPVEVPDA